MPKKYVPFVPEPIEGQAVLGNFIYNSSLNMVNIMWESCWKREVVFNL